MTSRLRTSFFLHAVRLAKLAIARWFSTALHAVKLAKLATSRWVDALWGYDVFIAHRRSDAAKYAKHLYDSLTAERISCFIDLIVHGPGDSLLVATRRHVAKSTVFVLLGSPDVLAVRRPVDWVEQEIDRYLTTHEVDPKVVLIDFGATIEDALASQASGGSLAHPIVGRVQPFLRLPENLAALSSPPSEEVLAAVRRNLDGRRRDQIRLRLFQGIAAVLTVLVIIAAALGLFAWQQKTEAENNLTLAIANESRTLSSLSRVALQEKRYSDAAKIALASWPRDRADKRPLLESSLQTLSEAMIEGRLHDRQWQASRAGVRGAFLLDGGDEVLSWSRDALHLWDTKTSQKWADMRHDGQISGTLLMKDQRRAVTWSEEDGSIRVWSIFEAKEVGTRINAGGVRGVKLAADQTRIIAWSENVVRVFNLNTGQHVGEEMPHAGQVRGAMWVDDDKKVLSWSATDMPSSNQFVSHIYVWDTATGKEVGPRLHQNGLLEGVLAFGDGQRFVTWGYDGRSCIWKLPAEECKEIEKGTQAVVMTRDEQRIVSAAEVITIWSAEGERVHSLPGTQGTKLALSPSDQRILSYGADPGHGVEVWDLARGQLIGRTTSRDGAAGARFSGDEQQIVSWSEYEETAKGNGYSMRVWDVASGEQLGPTILYAGSVVGAEFTKDQRHVISWHTDGTLRKTDIRTNQHGSPMKHKGGMDIRVTKDGRRAFSLSFAGVEAVTSTALTWWDLQVARRIWGPVVSDTVGGAFLINGETQVLTWGRNGRIRRWDLSNGQPIGEELYCTGAEVGPERISEVGPERISNVILAEDEQTMIVWRDNAWLHNPTFALCNANCGLIGPKMKGTPEGTAVSKDLRRALTWLPDGNLQLWDVATGKPLGPVLDRGVHGAIFMRDERRAISWSNNVIRQWDLETSLGREINHAGVVGAAVTNDGRRILSWSNELRIWDAETARQISPVIRSKNEFRGAALTNDEKRVISWSSEDVRVWDVASGRQIGPAMTIQHFHGKEALLLSDQKRVLTWGGLKYELLVWDIELPRGNLLELACAALADPTLGQIAQQYGVKDPICGPGLADTLTDWSKIELAPAAAVEAAR